MRNCIIVLTATAAMTFPAIAADAPGTAAPTTATVGTSASAATINTPTPNAVSATSTPPAMAAAPENPDDKVICVNNPPPTGSHMPGARECHTVAEWNMMHDELGRAVHRFIYKLQEENLRGGKSGPGSGGSGG